MPAVGVVFSHDCAPSKICPNDGAKTQAGSSARELIVRGRHKKPVITFCREIDQMLGGGVPRGELTEVRRHAYRHARLPARPVYRGDLNILMVPKKKLQTDHNHRRGQYDADIQRNVATHDV